MQDLTPAQRRARRTFVVLLFLLVLLATVAVASSGDTPVSTGSARRPADAFLDVLVSLFFVAMAAGTVLVVALLLFRQVAQKELERMGVKRPRRSALASSVAFFVVALLIGVGLRELRDDNTRTGPRVPRGPNAQQTEPDRANGAYQPEFATIPVLVVVGIGAAGATAAFLAYRARRRRLGDGTEGPLPLVLADVLDETLDDLRAEADPRKAVIAAYSRLERTLGAYGLPRRPSEAPDEYLARILVDLEVSARSVELLTALFARAKFSQHEVRAQMKEEAIEALETARGELRAAELRAEEERAAAREAARERAAAL